MNELAIIMPVFNEEEAVSKVVEEWLPVFRAATPRFEFWIVDDGSTDGTSRALKKLQEQNTEIQILDKTNSGHGRSCLFGYRKAVAEKVEWLFQLDSDGQCDPSFFPKFWSLRDQHPCLYGDRRIRDDGLSRKLISKILSFIIFLRKGVYLRDANVPYRLFRRSTLESWIPSVDAKLDLVNLEVAIHHRRHFEIHWVPIRFRQRFSGKSHSSTRVMLGRVLNFLRYSKS